MANEVKMESAADYQSPNGMAARWLKELDAAEKVLKPFHSECEKINKEYLDKRDAYNNDVSKINIFWSNTQVLKATLYAKPPKIDVSRIFRDGEDDVARVAGTILERMLNNDIEQDNSPFDAAIRQGIEDWLIVGLGQLWVRYEADIGRETTEAVMGPDGTEIVPAEEYEVVTYEDAVSEYVHWRDFYWSAGARTWEEVRWVARRVHMSRDALVKRFGEKIGKIVPMSRAKSSDEQAKANPWSTAEVFEIWCKENRTVYWYCRGMDTVLDYRPDPLELENFFPCPAPLVANVTSSAYLPRADYAMGQDLYRQINEAQTRLKYLVRACKVTGVYDRSQPEIKIIMQDGVENTLVPVENWALLGEKGGLKGVIDFVPIDMVAAVIGKLREEIAAAKAELYEVMGIADIMRGASDSSETATAQQIKAQYGSTRLQFKQFEVARWVRDAMRIKAEIICQHFQPETIAQRSNIERSTDAMYGQQAIELLKQDHLLMYRLSVEADSMAAMDWARERDARTEFMTAIGGYIQSVTPLVQASPEAAPLLMKLMQWGLGGFRIGKQIESAIDQAVQAIEQAQMQPEQPQQPDPKTAAEIERMTADSEAKRAQARKTSVETDAQMAMMGMAPLPPAQPSMAPAMPQQGAPL